MKGFICVKLKKNKKENLRDLRPAFLKERFFLYVTETVPVAFRQAFPLMFFFFFLLYGNRRASRGEGEASSAPFGKFEKSSQS